MAGETTTNEKKCPNPKCGSEDVYFQGSGVGVGVGERLADIQKLLFKCRACDADFWYTGQSP